MAKTLSMAGVGMGVGALIGGPAAAIAGAAGGKLIEGVADIGLDLLDEYLLDGVLKGWTPRVFIEKLDQASRKDLSRSRVEPRIRMNIRAAALCRFRSVVTDGSRPQAACQHRQKSAKR